jgi:hypothetical protein
VFSSLTNEKKVLELSKKEGFSAKLLEKKHISFEDILAYVFSLR